MQIKIGKRMLQHNNVAVLQETKKSGDYLQPGNTTLNSSRTHYYRST